MLRLAPYSFTESLEIGVDCFSQDCLIEKEALLGVCEFAGCIQVFHFSRNGIENY